VVRPQRFEEAIELRLGRDHGLFDDGGSSETEGLDGDVCVRVVESRDENGVVPLVITREWRGVVGDSAHPGARANLRGVDFVDAFDAQRAVHARKNDCFRIIAKAKKSSAWPAVAAFRFVSGPLDDDTVPHRQGAVLSSIREQPRDRVLSEPDRVVRERQA